MHISVEYTKRWCVLHYKIKSTMTGMGDNVIWPKELNRVFVFSPYVSQFSGIILKKNCKAKRITYNHCKQELHKRCTRHVVN